MANRIAKYDLRNRIAAYVGRSERVERHGNETRYIISEDGLELNGETFGNQRYVSLHTGVECWMWVYHVTEHDANIKNWTRLAGDPVGLCVGVARGSNAAGRQDCGSPRSIHGSLRHF